MFDELILYYRFPIYFFTNKRKPNLAKRLSYGLDQAMADQSVAKLLAKHPMTQKLFPKEKWYDKHFLFLENGFLPENTPLAQKGLWIQLNPKARTSAMP